MPEGQIVFFHRASGAGQIRPVRRRPNIRFERSGIVEADPLSLRRGDWVAYELSDATGKGPRRAVNVRRAGFPVHHTPGGLLPDSGVWDNIEREFEEYRQAVQRRWDQGELTPHQRAGLLVDAEYDRATRLTRIVCVAIGLGGAKGVDVLSHDTNDHAQEKGHMMNGQIRNVNERGYAFVRGEDGEDYFLHVSQLVDIAFQELRQHDTVSFQPADGPPGKGPIAVNAERVKRAGDSRDGATLPNEPAPGRWPTAVGREADEETVYDWGAAS